MYSVSDCQEKIEKELQNIQYPGIPTGLYEPIAYTLNNGGKHIRPVLTLMAHNLFSGEIESAIYPALGIEIFHNFTLLHDDVMDEADTRRGKATVHKKWDHNTAILSGDAMMILAYKYIAECPAHCFNSVFQVFNKTAMEVCEGQQYDMNFETDENVKLDDYLEMIRLKTSVLLAASLKIGAITGGANINQQGLLYQFGINVGLAFQLQDDYLDVYADPEKFGKTPGGDIIQNKKTFLLINALKKAKGEDAENLLAWLAKTDFDRNEKFEAVKEIYTNLGIDWITQEKSENYFNKAIKLLDDLDVETERKNVLLNMVNKIMERNR